MSALLDKPPYGDRDDDTFVGELAALTQHHLAGCPPYSRVWPGWAPSSEVADFPFLHVGAFKSLDFVTQGAEVKHLRVLKSSATTSGVSSRIALDRRSSPLQSRSSHAILADYLGTDTRPLVVLDSAAGLRDARELPARTAAALSLQPLATDVIFLLADAADPASARWEVLQQLLEDHERLLVYGFTFMLWTCWATGTMPEGVRRALRGRRVDFVHSGGWKKLEHLSVDAAHLDAALTAGLHPASQVLDFYGLVEQVGVIYPLCREGFRHVPVWADVIVRDPWSGCLLPDAEGQLQLVNVLAWGAPYHNVLTEDLGRLVPGPCPCGRRGKRFEFLRRMPRAEVRGCANV